MNYFRTFTELPVLKYLSSTILCGTDRPSYSNTVYCALIGGCASTMLRKHQQVVVVVEVKASKVCVWQGYAKLHQ